MTVWLNARTRACTLLLLFVSFFLSCKKDTASLGADFISARNGFQIGFDTTIDLKAYSVPMDSVVTSRLSAYGLGVINDPLLGTSKATLITQIGIPGNQFSWQGATQLDSVILQLPFRRAAYLSGNLLEDYYGDANAVHELKVYLLNEDLALNTNYYSSRTYQTDGVLMGSYSGTFNYTDTVTIKLGSETMKLLPQIRIPMNAAFRTLLFQAEQNGYFSSDADFKKQFKGLVVVDEAAPASGSGAIAYLRLNSNQTGLVAYYKDSLAANFHINAGNLQGSEAAYNSFSHNFPVGILQTPFTGQHRDTGYVQALTGAKLRIELPDFVSVFSNPKIVLNGAEIVFTALSGTTSSPYTLPASMSLVASDSVGRNAFLKDQLYETFGYYGGFVLNNQYRFRIVRQLQDILDQHRRGQNINYGMNLIIRADDPFTAQRVVFNTKKGSGALQLKLTYTYVNP